MAQAGEAMEFGRATKLCHRRHRAGVNIEEAVAFDVTGAHPKAETAIEFRNDTSKPLRFGIRAKEEMCILTGAIWSPMPNAEIAAESCVITWIAAQGIGHDARDNGGPPKPEPDQVLACRSIPSASRSSTTASAASATVALQR